MNLAVEFVKLRHEPSAASRCTGLDLPYKGNPGPKAANFEAPTDALTLPAKVNLGT